MTEAIINDFAELGAALKRIEEAKQPKTDVPEPAKIDWPSMYGVYQAPDDFMGWRDKVFANHLAASQGLREANARLNEANAMAIGTVKMPDGTIQTSKDWTEYTLPVVFERDVNETSAPADYMGYNGETVYELSFGARKIAQSETL